MLNANNADDCLGLDPIPEWVKPAYHPEVHRSFHDEIHRIDKERSILEALSDRSVALNEKMAAVMMKENDLLQRMRSTMILRNWNGNPNDPV